jgi:hypothetical protein
MPQNIADDSALPPAQAASALDGSSRSIPIADIQCGRIYQYLAPFDRAVLRREYNSVFSKQPQFSAASIPDFEKVLGFMEQDFRITDIRWMAYMLGTTFIEASKTVATTNSKGKSVKLWRNFLPTGENGKGKGLRYHLPVKVARMLDGSALVTEHDGEQWSIKGDGSARPVKASNRQGVRDGTAPAPTYASAQGDEKQYYGRGYVQLTWWSNYAKAGAASGAGLQYLFDPETVCVPSTAYKIMSTGMIGGGIFANGHRFADYFVGSHTDYVGARAMVNGHDKEAEIANLARLFEQILIASHPRWVGNGLRLQDSISRPARGQI